MLHNNFLKKLDLICYSEKSKNSEMKLNLYILTKNQKATGMRNKAKSISKS